MARLQQFATRMLAIISFKGVVKCKPLWGQGDFRLVAGERAQLGAEACLVDVVPQVCRHNMLAQVTGKRERLACLHEPKTPGAYPQWEAQVTSSLPQLLHPPADGMEGCIRQAVHQGLTFLPGQRGGNLEPSLMSLHSTPQHLYPCIAA